MHVCIEMGQYCCIKREMLMLAKAMHDPLPPSVGSNDSSAFASRIMTHQNVLSLYSLLESESTFNLGDIELKKNIYI